MSIDRRTATINGEKIAYTYNLRNRMVTVPSKGIEFIATCYDAAKTEITEALAQAAAPAKRTVMIGKADGAVHAARNYKTVCTGKARDFRIEYTDAAITCADCLTATATAAAVKVERERAAIAGLRLPNVFNTGTLHHEIAVLGDGTVVPKCRKRVTKGVAEYMETPFISCNSCSGAHLPGTRLG